MYKCCIFDLDGTLVDSIKAISYTSNLTLSKYGLAPISEEKYKIFVGDGYKKLIERALIYSGDKELINYEDALKTYTEYFEIHCMHEVKPYDGIKDMLHALKEKGVKIAVLSNKPHERTLDNIYGVFGEDYFDMVSGEKEGVRRKPDPIGAIITAESLGISPKECLYIGDTSTDMETGIKAGMDTIGVTWGFRTREELESYSPKYVIDHPSEITKIVSL
ncbi:HAD family hydrolase [Clostridium intestinale]|uniref:Phosphoglycolate phosphatase n=1 Tax=Clostridium intestinale DSM 6191 TaxID=1121320 RepID=A0A1M5WI88_9CLOT|nr:HAD family hydrolase [Clostridium intestinale]SHH87127.1 phosphoglycolate phosphatase [Clostridium intestinale DSM 6191]